MPRSPRLERRSPIAPSSGCVRTSIANPPFGRSSRKLRLYRAQGHALLEEFLRLCFTPQLPLGTSQGNHWGPALSVFETSSQTAYYFNAISAISETSPWSVPQVRARRSFSRFYRLRRSGLSRAPSCSSSTRIGVPKSSSAPWAGNMRCSHPGTHGLQSARAAGQWRKPRVPVPALRLHAETGR